MSRLQICDRQEQTHPPVWQGVHRSAGSSREGAPSTSGAKRGATRCRTGWSGYENWYRVNNLVYFFQQGFGMEGINVSFGIGAFPFTMLGGVSALGGHYDWPYRMKSTHIYTRFVNNTKLHFLSHTANIHCFWTATTRYILSTPLLLVLYNRFFPQGRSRGEGPGTHHGEGRSKQLHVFSSQWHS